MSRPITNYNKGSPPVDLGQVFAPMEIKTGTTATTTGTTWIWDLALIFTDPGLYICYTTYNNDSNYTNICYIIRSSAGYGLSNIVIPNIAFATATPFSLSGPANKLLTLNLGIPGTPSLTLKYFLVMPLT